MARPKKVGPCTSTEPRPDYKICPLFCDEVIPTEHWCCKDHWAALPLAMRLYGNQFKNHWEGDPVYDDFIGKARAVTQELEKQVAAQLDANPNWVPTE